MLVAPRTRLDCESEHRLGHPETGKANVGIRRRLVQHAVKADVLDFGHRADVAGHSGLDLDVVLALEPEQVAYLHGLARIVNVELAVLANRATVNPEHAEPADESIDRELEDVSDDAPVRLRIHLARHLTAPEGGRIRLRRVGHEPGDDLEQLGDPRPGRGGGEAHRNQVSLT